MFQRPEEFIMAILAILWVILSYIVSSYLDAPAYVSLLIGALNLIWATVFFIFWQRSYAISWVYPIFISLNVACWLPLLDWIAQQHAQTSLPPTLPWFGSTTFQIIIVLLPMMILYGLKLKRYWKNKKPTL